MRSLMIPLAGLFLSATLIGCGGSATIPAPPSQPTFTPPPGSSADMTTAKGKSGAPGGLGAAKPANK
jgi:hypothetical protein